MQILGLDTDGTIVNAALLNNKKEILDLNSFDLSAVKPLYIDKRLSKNTSLITGLDANKVLIKHKNLKMTKKKAIEKALPFQTELSSSISKDKSIIIPILGKKHTAATDLFFHITTTKALKDHLDALLEKDIDPDFVSSKVNALTRFAKYHFHELNEISILHIGKQQTTVVHMENSFAKSSYFIKIGTDDLLKEAEGRLNEGYSVLDFPKIFQTQSSNIHKTFYNELGRSFFLLEKNKNKKIPLLLTGQIGFFKNLDPFLLSKFSNYFSECLELNKPMHLPYAISIGLAIEALDEDKKSLQFRQKEHIPLKHFKKIGMTLLSIFFCSLVLSIFIYFQGSNIVNEKNTILQKNISLIEEKEHLHLKTLSGKNLEEALASYDKKIEKETRDFAYFLKFPKVSSVLIWINSFPSLKTKSDPIEIKLLNYQIIEKKNEEKTLLLDAKIYMEFSSSEKNAKKFHDLLLKADQIVDTKKSITFESDKNLYKTSFYLKKIETYDQ